MGSLGRTKGTSGSIGFPSVHSFMFAWVHSGAPMGLWVNSGSRGFTRAGLVVHSGSLGFASERLGVVGFIRVRVGSLVSSLVCA